MSTRTLRVVQATAWYPPFDLGGTEVYLEGLIDELRGLGVESSVLVPRHGAAANGDYVHDGTTVETYPVDAFPAPGELREGRPPLHFAAFQARLAAHTGAIYHQHSWSRGCGLHHLRAARARGLKTVLTMHVPANICLRGTMLLYGKRPCDGRVEERRCGACWAQERGLPRAAAGAVARLPLPFARWARRGGTRLATGLAARALGAERRAQVADMIASADRVVAVCRWLYDALAANGAPSGKLVLNRQGLSVAFLASAAGAAATPRSRKRPLRLVYVGRWDPIKGIDVIVRAIRALPRETDAQLTVHAVHGGAGDAAYEQRIRRIAKDDQRITFAGPLARGEIATALARHDALVVPSLLLETGPLVVMEAQAVGLYVIGSRLGGIAELIEEGACGELVEAGSVRAWTAATARLAERHAKGALAYRPREVRTMSTVAAEMAELYGSL
jgi:glycosyltransferase involved in cell wall biosynthesis